LWGTRLEIGEGKTLPALETRDKLVEQVSQRLSEQRERLLDLMDRVVSSLVAENCPRNRPPEDWDWQAIHEGFREHFRIKLSKQTDELGDIELVVRDVFKQAEGAYQQKEQKLGVENVLRAFRYFYLEEIDKAWVDHLTNLEHLRDGIGLRGYGQRDPKNEYKKEGYNLFLNMTADVSSSTLIKLFEFMPRGAEDLEQLEAAAEHRHEADMAAAVARHPDAAGEAPPDPGSAVPASLPPPAKAAPKVGRNDPCPCGSGKKFKQCHGAPLFDDDEEPGSATA
jgi:preprotein translocase subunit SecA